MKQYTYSWIYVIFIYLLCLDDEICKIGWNYNNSMSYIILRRVVLRGQPDAILNAIGNGIDFHSRK